MENKEKTKKGPSMATKMSLSTTTNLGNYESMKLEMEWTPLPDETEEESTRRAQKKMVGCITAALSDRLDRKIDSLNATAAFDMKQQGETTKIKLLTMSTKEEQAKVQAIVRKVESGVSLDTIFQWFTFDTKALDVLRVAAHLNCINVNW